MTASPALQVNDPAVGTPLALAADTQKGDTTATLGPADAATVTVGDYFLLYSEKPVDAEIPTKARRRDQADRRGRHSDWAITVDDQIYDNYLIADSAAMARISMVRNITLSDFSVTTLVPLFTGVAGLTIFRFVENLQIERVEAHHAYIAGISLLSVLNSKVSDCYIHHISDRQPPQNVRYGIVVSAASQNISITGCRFSHTRHAVTTGGSQRQPGKRGAAKHRYFQLHFHGRGHSTFRYARSRRERELCGLHGDRRCAGQAARKWSGFRCVALIVPSLDVRCCKRSAKGS